MPGLVERKLGGYDFYQKILRSPKFVVAPMVDQSELAWRKLSRRYGAQMFANAKTPYRNQMFDMENGEEGGPEDRPLIVQFCANDPEQLLAAAKIVEPYCDAVDINLGCPQDIARRGHYGAFLQDDWDLIFRLINVLHMHLSIPVTAKFRVFPTMEKTVAYAKMLESAGAQILTCHGRTREQRGQISGLADWEKIRAVKSAVSVPVFANGNILHHSDIQRCLRATGADAVMSAEGQLYNPAIFASADPGSHRHHTDLALEYLTIVKNLKTKTAPSAVKGHLFKLMRPGLAKETDLRNKLGQIRSGEGYLEQYVDVVTELQRRMKRDSEASEGLPLEEIIQVDSSTGPQVLPHWLSQPYLRPLLRPPSVTSTPK